MPKENKKNDQNLHHQPHHRLSQRRRVANGTGQSECKKSFAPKIFLKQQFKSYFELL
jgi:hypothetical protein